MIFAASSFCFFPLRNEHFDLEDRIINQQPITVTVLVDDNEKLSKIKEMTRIAMHDWFDNVLKRKDKYPDFDTVFKDIMPYLDPNINLEFIDSKNSYIKVEGLPFLQICTPQDDEKSCKEKIARQYQGQVPVAKDTSCYDMLFYEESDLLVVDFELYKHTDGASVSAELNSWMGNGGKKHLFPKAAPEEYQWMMNKEDPFRHSCVLLGKGLTELKYSVLTHEFGHAVFNIADQYEEGMKSNADTSKGSGIKKSLMNKNLFLTCDDADALVYSLYKRKYGQEPSFPSFCDYDRSSYPHYLSQEEVKKRIL